MSRVFGTTDKIKIDSLCVHSGSDFCRSVPHYLGDSYPTQLQCADIPPFFASSCGRFLTCREWMVREGDRGEPASRRSPTLRPSPNGGWTPARVSARE